MHLSNTYLNAGHKSLQGQGGANTAAEEGERGGEGQGGGEGDLQEGVVEQRREARVVRVVEFVSDSLFICAQAQQITFPFAISTVGDGNMRFSCIFLDFYNLHFVSVFVLQFFLNISNSLGTERKG